MKLKLFVDTEAGTVERAVNRWFCERPKCEVIKSETTVSFILAPNLYGDQTMQQRISMAVWYNEPSN
jgi:hypothetical protein